VGAVLVVGFLGLYVYLGSSSIAQQVRARLKQLLNVEVAVGSARIGLVGNSTAQDVTVQERNQPVGETPPLIRITEAILDLTLLGALGDGMPAGVDLNKADLYLRFGADGKLLTALPDLQGGGTVPPVQIHNGTVTLDQVGRQPIKFSGVNVKITRGSDGFAIQGQLDDPDWGTWAVDSSFQPASKLFTLHLTNPKAEAEMGRLRKLPFVSPNVWTAVEVSGTTAVDFDVRVPIGQKVNYTIDLDVARANIHVPSIELKASEVSGKVRIKDSVVLLDNLKGNFAEGTLSTKADLNFTKSPSVLKFGIQADEISLTSLPDSWGLPKGLRGKGDMKAILLVEIASTGVNTSGQGDGDIHDASYGELKLSRVPLKLYSDGRKFRFRPMGLKIPGLPFLQWPLQGALDPDPEDGRVKSVAFGPPEAGDPIEMFRQGTRALGEMAGTGIDSIWHGLERLIRARRPNEPVTYLEADAGMDGVDLQDLVKQAGLTLPMRVSGKATFRIRLSIPLEPAAPLRDYRLTGNVSVADLRLADVRVPSGVAALQFTSGVLTLGTAGGFVLVPIPGEAPPNLGPLAVLGSAYLLNLPTAAFNGAARVQLDPMGNLEANLSVHRAPLDRYLTGLTGGAIRPSGVIEGEVSLTAPLLRLNALEAWTARGVVRVPDLDVAGVRLRDVRIEPTLNGENLLIPSLTGTVQGTPLAGAGSFDLRTFRVNGTVQLARANVAAFPVPAEVQGQLNVRVNIGGNLRDGTTLSGNIDGDRLVLAGFRLEQPSADWRVDGQLLRLDRLTATFARGPISGSGTIPLTARQAGKISVQARNIFLGELARQIPGLPIRVAGLVEGTLNIGLGAIPADGERPVTVDLDLTAPRLLLQDLAVHKATTRLTYDGQVAKLRVRGETLGGEGNLEGTFRVRGDDAPSWEGTAELKGMRLDRLDAELGGDMGLQALRGTLDLDFRASQPSDELPTTGKGKIQVRGLAWQGQEVADDLRAPLELDGPMLRIREIESRVAGGSLRVALGLNLRHLERSRFRIDLKVPDLARILGPLFQSPRTEGSVQPLRGDESTDKLAEGPVELTLHGHLGREWSGIGAVVLTHGKISGAEVEELRLPFTFNWSPMLGSGTLTAEDSTGRVGRGQVRGGLTVHWADNGRSLELDGGFRFQEVELRSVFPKQDELRSLGAGRIAGRLDFNGHNVRSLDDINATLEATLNKTQALQMPVLRGLTPFLKAVRGDLTFDTGFLQARLARGIIRVHRLQLNSPVVRLSVSGTLTTTGRLDMEAIALVGAEVLAGVSPSLVSRVPPTGPVPSPALTELCRLVTDRAVHFRITGNMRSPITRVEPLKSLDDETARFLIGTGLVPGSR
jgi:hypothetical protein